MTAFLLPVALVLGAAGGARADRPPAPAPSPLDPGTHEVEVRGARLVYHVAGSGPPCLVFPGGPGFHWEYLRMPEVERVLTMIYVEPVGTGASARLADPGEYSRERDVADLEGLRQAIGLEAPYLLGHSYGGRVALDYALAHGDRLRGLILYDTAPMSGPAWRADVDRRMGRLRRHRWARAAWAACGRQNAARTDEEAAEATRGCSPFYFHDYAHRHAEIDRYLAGLRVSFERSRKGRSIPHDVRERLGELRVPTLILVGASDVVCSPKMAALLHRGIRGSRLVTLAGSGHYGHVEEPAAFAQGVAGFVARTERRRARAVRPPRSPSR